MDAIGKDADALRIKKATAGYFTRRNRSMAAYTRAAEDSDMLKN